MGGTDRSVNVTSGITFGYQVHFNSYYSTECNDSTLYDEWQDVPSCKHNFDYGIMAKKKFDVVFEKEGFLADFQDLISAKPSSDNIWGLGWNNTLIVGMGEQSQSHDSHTIEITFAPTAAPTESPTESPTSTPTLSPTAVPTETPTQTPTGRQCGPYSNNIDDFEYLGNGTDCRAGLNMSYPGGLTCD